MVKLLPNIEHQDCSDAEVLISVKAEKVNKQTPSSNGGGSESFQIRAHFPKSADASKPRLSGFIVGDTLIIVSLWCASFVTSFSDKASILTRSVLKSAHFQQYCACRFASNIGILLLNKYVLGIFGFAYPIFLTECHMLACTFLSEARISCFLHHLSQITVVDPLPFWECVGKARGIMRYLYISFKGLPAIKAGTKSKIHACICQLILSQMGHITRCGCTQQPIFA